MKLNKQIALGTLAFALSSGSVYAQGNKWNPLNWFRNASADAPSDTAPCPGHKHNLNFVNTIDPKSEHPNVKAAAYLTGATICAGGTYFFGDLASKPLKRLLERYVYPRVKVTTEEGKEFRKKVFEQGIPTTLSLLLGTYLVAKVKNNTLSA